MRTPRDRQVEPEHAPWFLVRCAPGLEGLLADEAGERLHAAPAQVGSGLAQIAFTGHPQRLGELLVADDVWVFVRAIAGDFRQERHLSALRSKLARTNPERALTSLRRVQPVPAKPRVHLTGVAHGGSLRFYDLQRECRDVVAGILGGVPVDEGGDVGALLVCAAEYAFLGLRLPAAPFAASPGLLRAAHGHASVAGAIIWLARPVPGVSVCDPDAAEGSLLAAWSQVAPPRRAVGLDRRALEPGGGISVLEALPSRWPVEDHSLSRVVSLLPRVRQPLQMAELLGEVARCLAAGGCAALATPLADVLQTGLTAQPLLRVTARHTARLGDERLTLFALAAESGEHRPIVETTAGDRFRASRPEAGPRRLSAGRPERRGSPAGEREAPRRERTEDRPPRRPGDRAAGRPPQRRDRGGPPRERAEDRPPRRPDRDRPSGPPRPRDRGGPPRERAEDRPPRRPDRDRPGGPPRPRDRSGPPRGPAEDRPPRRPDRDRPGGPPRPRGRNGPPRGRAEDRPPRRPDRDRPGGPSRPRDREAPRRGPAGPRPGGPKGRRPERGQRTERPGPAGGRPPRPSRERPPSRDD